MEKKRFRKDVGKEAQFDAEVCITTHPTIDEVIDFFVKAKKEGATHVDWHAETDWDRDSESCKAQPFYEIEETDEEWQLRLHQEEEAAREKRKEQEIKERKMYERLKEKYGRK